VPVSIGRKILEIEKTLYRLSKEITESDLNNPLLIGIPRRGDLLAKRISDYLVELNFTHELDTVNYRPFRDDVEENIEKTHLTISPQDRNVILIDDVIYTGRTLRSSIEAVIYSGRPKSITLTCLIDRGHRELPISPKFVGKNIPTNESEYVSVFLKEIDKEDRVEIH
tara:strand:- start:2168 stop:2671 length:504 start_codon:yes stop_codon:yes gene_type:complete